MSKKQQVEKVQKCNAVISAFQAGVRDRQAGAKQDGELEEKEPPAGPSAGPEEKNPEEAKPEDADKSSSLQQVAAPARDECKVNQEAWSRLRDGRGLEPEDLDKSHQLTPPAFVRPKRQADDDQPVEVEQDKKEQVGGTHHPANQIARFGVCFTTQNLDKQTVDDQGRQGAFSQKLATFSEKFIKKKKKNFVIFIPVKITKSWRDETP